MILSMTKKKHLFFLVVLISPRLQVGVSMSHGPRQKKQWVL
jgi:hypothetical protein